MDVLSGEMDRLSTASGLSESSTSHRNGYYICTANYRNEIMCKGTLKIFSVAAISIGIIGYLTKIAKNLLRTYEKLNCKGEPYRLSGHT